MKQNVHMKIEGGDLVLRIKLDANLGPSQTGKTTLVATTGGNVPVPGTRIATFVGLTMFRRDVR